MAKSRHLDSSVHCHTLVKQQHISNAVVPPTQRSLQMDDLEHTKTADLEVSHLSYGTLLAFESNSIRRLQP